MNELYKDIHRRLLNLVYNHYYLMFSLYLPTDKGFHRYDMKYNTVCLLNEN